MSGFFTWLKHITAFLRTLDIQTGRLDNQMTIQASRFFTLALLVALCGCKAENPVPELLDPVYADLVSTQKSLEQKIEAEEKKVETLQKELEKTHPRTVERKVTTRDLKSARDRLTKMYQQVRFYEIRSEHRKVVARREYRIAFRKGENWPDPNEIKMYKLNKELRAVNLSWDARLPKLNRYTASKDEGGKKSDETGGEPAKE